MKDRQGLTNFVACALDTFLEPQWNSPRKTTTQPAEDFNNAYEIENTEPINRESGNTNDSMYGQHFMVDYLTLRNG